MTSLLVSNDSKRIIVMLEASEEHSIIEQYDTDSYSKHFQKDLKGNYIKAKDII